MFFVVVGFFVFCFLVGVGGLLLGNPLQYGWIMCKMTMYSENTLVSVRKKNVLFLFLFFSAPHASYTKGAHYTASETSTERLIPIHTRSTSGTLKFFLI